MSDAIVVCQQCGLPVRVTFDDAGEISQVFAVCGHPVSPSDVDDDGYLPADRYDHIERDVQAFCDASPHPLSARTIATAAVDIAISLGYVEPTVWGGHWPREVTP